MITGPSSSTAPYLLGSEPNVHFTSIITVGDALSPGGTTGVFGGLADGLGAFDNGDGTFTALVAHEIRDTAGAVRDHGSIGAYIDRLVIDKSTLQVVSGDDAIQTVHLWDDVNDTYVTGTTAFNRFCSADLAAPTAFYDAATGLGTQARIFLTGEESGLEGRATATIVSGADNGSLYELPYLGNLAFENLTANPFAQTKTIVAATDDGTNGQVYIYVGDKQATGSDIDKAGLTNGAFYGIKVTGFTDETDVTAANGAFTLETIADASNKTGAQIDADSEAQGVTSFLRPEDSAWDPQNPNVLYFVTTNSFAGNSRLYKATFTDVTQPELGGTIEAVLDGSEGQRMFDNISVANGKVILQEDPGNQAYVAKAWEYDIAHDTLAQVAGFDPAQFTPLAPGFITQDEESSGVIDVTNLLGDSDTRAYLLDAQVHAATGNPATVEYGQLLAMFVDTPVTVGGKGDDYLFGSQADETFTGKMGNDTIDAGSGNDVLNGDAGNDVLNGGAGNDNLMGGAGNDILNSRVGNDELNGGGGNDVLNGGIGLDTLRGGAGADLFVFTAADSNFAGLDKIVDFNAVQGDRIDLSAFHITAADLSISHVARTSYVVAVDLDHDGGADFGLAVTSRAALTTADFLL